MSAAQERDLAIRVARTDPSLAFQRARKVSEPWHQSQALAWVARFAPEMDVERIAGEALKTAGEGRDTYRQVAVSAWAVRALAERGRSRRAEEAVAKLVPLSGQIDHPVSRLNAQRLLWQAVWPLERGTWQQVLDALVRSCREAKSWQAGRAMYTVVLMLAPEDPEQARRLLEEMPEGRYRRQAERELGNGRALTPRPFFW